MLLWKLPLVGKAHPNIVSVKFPFGMTGNAEE